MKYLLIILLLIGCVSNFSSNIITYKSIRVANEFDYTYLPEKICTFCYDNGQRCFVDSCKFYYVGDTIGKIRKVKY